MSHDMKAISGRKQFYRRFLDKIILIPIIYIHKFVSFDGIALFFQHYSGIIYQFTHIDLLKLLVIILSRYVLYILGFLSGFPVNYSLF